MDDLARHINIYTYTLVSCSTGYFIYDAFDICLNQRALKEKEVMYHHFAVSCLRI